MIRLLRGELIKVRTTRTALGFGAAAVLLVLAVVLVTILAGNPTTIADKRDALNVGGALSIPLLLFGIVGATGEFRHHTLAPAVLIAPDRVRLTLARVGAYVLTAVVVGAAMVAVALVLGVPFSAASLVLTCEARTTRGSSPAGSSRPSWRWRSGRASACSCATRSPASSARSCGCSSSSL